MFNNKIVKLQKDQFLEAESIAYLIDNDQKRKLSFINTCALFAFKNYVEKNKYKYDPVTKISLFRVPKVYEKFEITDLYIGDARVDVRASLNGDTFPIPKSHIRNSYAADFYVVFKKTKNPLKCEAIGYIKKDELIFDSQDANYYYISTSMLKPIENLKEEMDDFEKPQKQFFETEHKISIDNFGEFLDGGLDEVKSIDLIEHLLDCEECRGLFVEYSFLEDILSAAKFYPEIKDELENELQLIEKLPQEESQEKENYEETINEEEPIVDENISLIQAPVVEEVITPAEELLPQEDIQIIEAQSEGDELSSEEETSYNQDMPLEPENNEIIENIEQKDEEFIQIDENVNDEYEITEIQPDENIVINEETESIYEIESNQQEEISDNVEILNENYQAEQPVEEVKDNFEDIKQSEEKIQEELPVEITQENVEISDNRGEENSIVDFNEAVIVNESPIEHIQEYNQEPVQEINENSYEEIEQEDISVELNDEENPITLTDENIIVNEDLSQENQLSSTLEKEISQTSDVEEPISNNIFEETENYKYEKTVEPVEEESQKGLDLDIAIEENNNSTSDEITFDTNWNQLFSKNAQPMETININEEPQVNNIPKQNKEEKFEINEPTKEPVNTFGNNTSNRAIMTDMSEGAVSEKIKTRVEKTQNPLGVKIAVATAFCATIIAVAGFLIVNGHSNSNVNKNNTEFVPPIETTQTDDINQSITNAFSNNQESLRVSDVSWSKSASVELTTELKEYLSVLGNKIWDDLEYKTKSIQNYNISTPVKVIVKINSQGEITNIMLGQSCGFEEVDNVILQSVKEISSEIPPSAYSVTGNNINLILVVKF